MPSPRAGESRDDFLDRCIPEVVAEGRDPDQAVAMCIAYYEGEKDKAFNLDKTGEVEYWKAMDRRRESFVSKYTRRFIKAINDQVRIYEDASTVADFRREIDPQIMKDAYMDLYIEVGDRFARTTWAGLKSMPFVETKQDPQWIEELRRYVDVDLAKRLADLNKTTRRYIDMAVAKALEEGLAIEEIRDRIIATSGQGSINGMTPARAERIARTEIVSASNAGSMFGAMSTGLNFKTQWVSTKDDRTRDGDDEWNHEAMDGEVVNRGEPFVMYSQTGEINEMRYPGDPNGSAGNVINCRCTQIYITED